MPLHRHKQETTPVSLELEDSLSRSSVGWGAAYLQPAWVHCLRAASPLTQRGIHVS